MKSRKSVIAIALVAVLLVNLYYFSTRTTEAASEGDRYGLGYDIGTILANYSYFVEGSLKGDGGSHTISGLVCGDLSLDNYVGNVCLAPCFVRNISKLSGMGWANQYKQYFPNMNKVLYYGTSAESMEYFNKADFDVVHNSDYINLREAFIAIEAQSDAVAKAGSTDAYTIENGLLTIDFSKAHNVTVDSDVSDVWGVRFKGATFQDFQKDTYVINIVEGTSFNLAFWNVTDDISNCDYGNNMKNKLAGTVDGGQLCPAGLNLVWNVPNGTLVNMKHLCGHLVAPRSYVCLSGGAHEGNVIAAAAEINGESHFYPYNTTYSIPTTPSVFVPEEPETEEEIVPEIPTEVETTTEEVTEVETTTEEVTEVETTTETVTEPETTTAAPTKATEPETTTAASTVAPTKATEPETTTAAPTKATEPETTTAAPTVAPTKATEPETTTAAPTVAPTKATEPETTKAAPTVAPTKATEPETTKAAPTVAPTKATEPETTTAAPTVAPTKATEPETTTAPTVAPTKATEPETTKAAPTVAPTKATESETTTAEPTTEAPTHVNRVPIRPTEPETTTAEPTTEAETTTAVPTEPETTTAEPTTEVETTAPTEPETTTEAPTHTTVTPIKPTEPEPTTEVEPTTEASTETEPTTEASTVPTEPETTVASTEAETTTKEPEETAPHTGNRLPEKPTEPVTEEPTTEAPTEPETTTEAPTEPRVEKKPLVVVVVPSETEAPTEAEKITETETVAETENSNGPVITVEPSDDDDDDDDTPVSVMAPAETPEAPAVTTRVLGDSIVIPDYVPRTLASNTTNPKTGDASNPVMWFGISALMLMVFGVSMKKKRREE